MGVPDVDAVASYYEDFGLRRVGDRPGRGLLTQHGRDRLTPIPETSVLIPTTGDIGTVRKHAALADQVGYGDVAAGVARYRTAGAANPMITNIAGTDLGPTLAAAVSA